MTIVRKDKGLYCRFDELEIGEVFIEDADDDEFIQMKTEELGEKDSYCNAVSLETGDMYRLDSHALVRRVHAELIITNIEKA